MEQMNSPTVWISLILVLPSFLGVQTAREQSMCRHAITHIDEDSRHQYDFLVPLVQSAHVVALGESIHMTHEFPLIQLGIVQLLNTELQYQTLAFEGSTEDLWVSQDLLLHNPSMVSNATSGLYSVWNTPELRATFSYEVSSWRTDHPLYITAYDIQPGTGWGSRGDLVFQLLANSLQHYTPPPPQLTTASLVRSLRPLTHACATFTSRDDFAVRHSIDLLQEWINHAVPHVRTEFPNLPHADMLQLIPSNLLQSLALCEEYRATAVTNATTYKTVRDTYAAAFTHTLIAAASNHKLILWAHVSHLSYNGDERGSTSVGEILHKSLLGQLYTIGTFAESGSAIMLFSDWNNISGYGRVWGVSRPIDQLLTPSPPQACFYEVSDGTSSALGRVQRVWIESRPSNVILSRDFDGIIVVRQVHPPHMALAALLGVMSWPYWMIVGGSTLVLLLLGISLIRLIKSCLLLGSRRLTVQRSNRLKG